MSIRLDYTNMLADAIGEPCGISQDELDALRKPAQAIHQDLTQRREQGLLPFYDLPFDRAVLESVKQLGDQLAGRCSHFVVLGIGGSALGTLALFRALRPLYHNLLPAAERGGRPRLLILDNVDPAGFGEALDLLTPDETIFCVISKSGSTVETSCQLMIARHWLETALGDRWRDHLVVITDPESGSLRELAEREQLTSCAIPSGVGGRFSVLTPVGLLPLAVAGVDIDALLAGAAEMEERVTRPDLLENPAYLNAALQVLSYRKGQHISVLMPYSDRLRDIADWYRQLWAESLGKRTALDGSRVHVGPTPVKALGTTDQHSQVQLYMEGPFDKVVTFLAVEDYGRDLVFPAFPGAGHLDYLSGRSMTELIQAEQQATAAALTSNGRPNCTLTLDRVSPQNVGGLVYLFEVQTLFAGGLFGVDPLDQPGVEEGKKYTYGLMDRPGFEEMKQRFESIVGGVTRRQL
ncbi:glucose-6-phosphate isomerase [Geothermobacter hydrogeniphilus]|uniref:Glucose-6-phosphate isomerase n=1 Tax=Geothermobacter hydrogeniphilus TaxID=1969733 RepID=A0A2K2HCJ3_9BACT|nr:glucose-6-phosphate isomerase [Geothermobacter hydrogeniphilus]PNU20973.1 glucose-6-phosphate isomerase [Geothermobacter hydrogeniphilus]